MTHPATPHRISRRGPRVPRARLGGPCALALVLTLAACGVEPDDEPGGTPEEAATGAAAMEAPPGTDIWLGDLVGEGDALAVTGLRNVTSRPGYDNQPSFLPDGGAFLYTAIDSTGRADIWRFDLAGDSAVRVTDTQPESEYSPTPLPGDEGFSTVRVEADSTQRLWRFEADGSAPSLLFPEIEPVGYHAWVGPDRVALFVLGDPPTLRVADRRSGEVREVARDIGRSIRTVPGDDAVSFVQLLSSGGEAEEGATEPAADRGPATRIMLWSPTGGVTPLTDGPGGGAGGDFHAWTPDGLLLMGRGAEIVAWREGREGWRIVGRVPGEGAVSRLAVSPDGSRIAVVVEPGGDG